MHRQTTVAKDRSRDYNPVIHVVNAPPTLPKHVLKSQIDAWFPSWDYIALQTNITNFTFPSFLVTSILYSFYSFPYSNWATGVGNGPL